MRCIAHISEDRPPASVLVPLLSGCSFMFGAAVLLRRLGYDSGFFPVHRVERPVISVGNLRVGGAGKTPFVRLLATELASMGRRVAVVSRGYGRRFSGREPLVVSRGRPPAASRAPVLHSDRLIDEGGALGGCPEARVWAAGDEPFLLALTTDAIVIVGENRVAAASRAVESGADVVLLDDGFQHRRLHRDLDIVILDARRPFATGRLLPWGSLREPKSALSRADLVVLNHGARFCEGARDRLQRTIEPEASVIEVATVPVGLFSLGPDEPEMKAPLAPIDLSGEPVALFSAIARPSSFRETIEALGASVVHEHRDRDHAWPNARTVERFFAEARARGARRFVTTEKDAVRLACLPERNVFESATLEVLAIEHRIVGDRRALDAALHRVLDRGEK